MARGTGKKKRRKGASRVSLPFLPPFNSVSLPPSSRLFLLSPRFYRRADYPITELNWPDHPINAVCLRTRAVSRDQRRYAPAEEEGSILYSGVLRRIPKSDRETERMFAADRLIKIILISRRRMRLICDVVRNRYRDRYESSSPIRRAKYSSSQEYAKIRH